MARVVNMVVVTDLLLLLLALMVSVGWCQLNNQPIQPGTYYMDSNADCNGPVREIYGQTVRVIGHGAIQEQQGPQSCTLTLKSAANFDHTNLQLSVVAATIRDCDVRLTMFDGDPGQGTLRGYDCNTPVKPNERDFVTTGEIVSFVLERRDSINTLYDIEIFVRPLVSGSEPGYENDYGDSWGFFREKLENDIAIGIVGAVFAVTLILITIGMVCCYRRFRGMNKPWEQHQLATFQPPAGTSIYETKSHMSDASSGVWTSNVSRARAESAPRRRIEPNRHMARASEDEDSVFDDASDVPPKKQLMERERRWERERQRERERERQRGRGRDFATQNSSYSPADDDHPQDTFVERIIEPRRRPGRLHKPPSYDEAINETETEKSDLEDEEEEDTDNKETSEEESEQQSSEEEEEEEEEEADGGASPPRRAPKPSARPQAQPPPPPMPSAVPLRPGMQPHPAYPGYPPMGYMGGYPVPPGQFVPVVAAPPGQPFQPMAPRPTHPPQYPGERPTQGNVKPTDPPIYSYLVQRGYTPLDTGRDSPVSLANTSQSQASMDDSDKNILASGVEYMRR